MDVPPGENTSPDSDQETPQSSCQTNRTNGPMKMARSQGKHNQPEQSGMEKTPGSEETTGARNEENQDVPQPVEAAAKTRSGKWANRLRRRSNRHSPEDD